MLLESLSEHETVESAAKAFAGNWQRWSHFVWFGADSVPHAENVMLGYLINHVGGPVQEAQAQLAHKILSPYFGDLSTGALADRYSANLCGDKDSLSGVAVRVYQGGEITTPFRCLYQLARRWVRFENPYGTRHISSCEIVDLTTAIGAAFCDCFLGSDDWNLPAVDTEGRLLDIIEGTQWLREYFLRSLEFALESGAEPNSLYEDFGEEKALMEFGIEGTDEWTWVEWEFAGRNSGGAYLFLLRCQDGSDTILWLNTNAFDDKAKAQNLIDSARALLPECRPPFRSFFDGN